MKFIILFLTLLSSNLVFAFTYDPKETVCFKVDGKNKVEKCTSTLFISSDVNVVLLKMKSGQVTILDVQAHDYRAEQTLVGVSEESATLGKNYYRDAKTKNIISKFKDGDWACSKQIKGKIDICYKF